MFGIVPLGVRVGGEHFFEGAADLFLSCELFTVDVRSRGSFKHAIIGHVRHDGIEIVRIERIREGLQEGFGYLPVGLSHKDCGK